MNDHDLTRERRAVWFAARCLAEEAPALTAASAGALRAGLAARFATLRRAALAASRAGVPPRAIAQDSGLPPATVLQWIAEDRRSHLTANSG
ncbi:hypothetical protein [Streptomyces inhibens]|uniref:hypothetical protein n=1 Tax=Streptomyces inhibens TaxID=2293571 RepID=UPI001EE6E213|nr:hypothetical protein [Streptomyces inhibens]UKY47747.1 hypothetical protein KI385_02125 [Streptomyces inhibens]